MNKLSEFAPSRSERDELASVIGHEVIVRAEDNLSIQKIYLRKISGRWLTLEWNYSDVGPKFEVFHILILSDTELPTGAIQVETIPPYSSLALAYRCEWVRPVKPGEVPEDYEQVIEENGPEKLIPLDAISSAKSLYGVLFLNDIGEAVFAVHISENVIDSLAYTSEGPEIERILESCDIVRAEPGV